MVASRKPKPGSEPLPLTSHVAARIKSVVLPGQCLVLGLSGGIDSVVLLDVLARLAPRMRFDLHALHVNHQLSPNASAWARFCRAACRSRSVPCRVVKVEVRRSNSIESAARDARYAALAASRADFIVLAHNLDDQAETVILQLLRGTGVKGLAGMPFVRRLGAPPVFVMRPLLELPRTEIERYARRRKLEWIDDESNMQPRYTRNWLRAEVMPRIGERAPAYRQALSRAARNLGEAAMLLDQLAEIDLATAVQGEALRVDALRALSAARAKNLLRFLIDAHGWRMPESARLTEALRQVLHARADRVLAVELGSGELRRHGNRIHLLAHRKRTVDGAVVHWRGEDEIALPEGVLTMARGRGEGMSARKLESAPVTIRQRRGGERLQPDERRPRRTVKNLLQEAGIPPWRRDRLPFIYCGDVLACVPGIGIDYRFQAARGEPSVAASWREL